MGLTNLVDSALTPSAASPTVDSTSDATSADFEPVLPVGTKVEVRRKFDDKWASGFEVAEATPTGFRLRRLSDGEMIPVAFAPDDVRKERKRNNWWY